MAFDAAKPADDEFLSAFPAEMREQLRALVHDQVVDAMKVQGLSPGNLTGNLAVNNGTLNKNLNAEMLGGHAADYYSPEGHVHAVATPSSDGFIANTDKSKLDGIATGAEVNQNAFSNVVIGDKTIQADSKTDTLTFEAGANIQITPDPTNDKVTIALNGTVPEATRAASATNDKNGKDIAATYFPLTGGTISGDITANQYYANGWFRSSGDSGWFSQTHGGGWYMSDDTWIRAYNNKSVYTPQKMQADGGFYGALHGTADAATNAGNSEKISNDQTYMHFHWNGQSGQPTWLWGSPDDCANTYVYNPVNFNVNSSQYIRPISGNSNYRLAYTADGQRANAGEWGRVVMYYPPDGKTYGVRCDRADYADSAGSVAGWSVDSFKRNLCGRSTPTLTPLIDWNQNTKTVNSSSYGCVGTSGQDIHLTQSWKNFDKILVKSWHGGAWLMKSTVWEKWELEQMFNGTGMIDITNGTSIDYYIYASNQGTTAHPLSTETTWYRYDSNCYIQEIYGVNY